MEDWTDDFGVRVKVHDTGLCAGEFCTIHNNSDHALCFAPQKWNQYYSAVLRVCVHGIEHLDVDTPENPKAVSLLMDLDENLDNKCFTNCDACCRFEENDNE